MPLGRYDCDNCVGGFVPGNRPGVYGRCPYCNNGVIEWVPDGLLKAVGMAKAKVTEIANDVASLCRQVGLGVDGGRI